MNTVQMILDVILTLGLPPMIGVVYWFSRLYTQRLPEYQRVALEQFAKQSVRYVEQRYTHNPSKKSLAESAITDLFLSFNLPVPGKAALDVAIEAAVHELQSSSSPKAK